MNDKGSGYWERLFVSMNKRVLIIPFGLLVTSLAHGLTEDGMGEDCPISPGSESSSSRSGEALTCTPLTPESDGKAEGKDQLSQNLQSVDPAETQDVDSKTPDERAAEAESQDAQAVEAESPDAQAVEAEGSDAQATQADAPNAEAADTQEADKQSIDEPDTVTQATDGSGGRVDGSAVAPQQSIELFKSDIETPESARGEESPVSDRDLFSMGLSTLHTTDDFDARTYSLSYRNNRREWFWPWQEATRHGLDWGLDMDRSRGELGPTEFQSSHVQGTLGAYLTPGIYLQGQVGEHTLETDVGDRTIKSNSVTAMFGLDRDFSAQLATRRDFLYPEGLVPAGITVQLTARDYTASFRWRPNQRLRIQGNGTYRKFDDENDSQTGELSALYGISPSWPWVWAGVGVQQMGYDRQVSNYWSPDDFTAYGLRFDSSFPLNERLSGSVAANLDRLDEDGSKGTGYFLQAGLQYQMDGQLYARLDLNESKSLQRASTWTSDSVIFWLNGPLF